MRLVAGGVMRGVVDTGGMEYAHGDDYEGLVPDRGESSRRVEASADKPVLSNQGTLAAPAASAAPVIPADSTTSAAFAPDSAPASADVQDDATPIQSRDGEVAAGIPVPHGCVVLAATPIGNTGDASLRLIALLQQADIVAAEDTRRLYDLARRLGVHVNGRVVANHDHNERQKADSLLDEVEGGATVLLVSDAGMPTINDPGLAIVRRAIERGLPVTCAPGPSAVLDALALAGLPTDRFCYEGFVPRKASDREQRLRSLHNEMRTMVFYEAPHRIDETMDALLAAFGPDRQMALCRELTKDYEQVRRGTIRQVRQSVVDDPPRGEIVLVIAGASTEEVNEASAEVLTDEQLARLAQERSEAEGIRMKDAIAEVVKEHPLPDGSFPNRKKVYQASLLLK